MDNRSIIIIFIVAFSLSLTNLFFTGHHGSQIHELQAQVKELIVYQNSESATPPCDCQRELANVTNDSVDRDSKLLKVISEVVRRVVNLELMVSHLINDVKNLNANMRTLMIPQTKEKK